jgi:hypothetical protein
MIAAALLTRPAPLWRVRLLLAEDMLGDTAAAVDHSCLMPDAVELWLFALDEPGFSATGRPPRQEEAQRRLREVLGSMLNCPAEAVELIIGARGKPALRASGTPPLFFNMSRSDHFVLIAVGGCELGVDIERIVPRVLHRDGLGDDLDPIERLRRWTRREAVAKAIGIGLTARFRLPLRQPIGSVQYGGTLWAWRDLALPPACRVVAALAVRQVEPARCG